MRQEMIPENIRRDQIKESLLNEVADPILTPFPYERGYGDYPMGSPYEYDRPGDNWYRPYPQSFPAVPPGFIPGQEDSYIEDDEDITPGRPGRGVRPITKPGGQGFGQDGDPGSKQPGRGPRGGGRRGG